MTVPTGRDSQGQVAVALKGPRWGSSLFLPNDLVVEDVGVRDDDKSYSKDFV